MSLTSRRWVRRGVVGAFVAGAVVGGVVVTTTVVTGAAATGVGPVSATSVRVAPTPTPAAAVSEAVASSALGLAARRSSRDSMTPSERRVIGYSVKGRPITAVRYGSESATRVGVVIGEIHGTERAGIPVVRQLQRLGAPAHAAMWVIRTVNPDGHAARSRKNARGVDLNRNTSHLWSGSSRSPDYYPGPKAMSEPETRAYMSFLDAIDPDVVLIYHQAGNGVDSYQAKDLRLVRGLATRMNLRVRSFNCDGECRGTLTGWFNSSQDGAAITIELPSTATNAQTLKWADAARWAMAGAA